MGITTKVRYMRSADAALTPSTSSPLASGGLPITIVRTKPIGTRIDDLRACESLGSWVVRLAAANGLTSPTEMLRFAGSTARPNFDAPPDVDETVRMLCSLSGRAAGEIEPMLLRSAISAPPKDRVGFFLRDWALKENSLIHRWEVRHVICPECLARDAIPYWRRSWRLALTVSCHIHGLEMLERCLRCGNTFVAPRRNHASLRECSACKSPIERNEPLKYRYSGGDIWKALCMIYDREGISGISRDSMKSCTSIRRLLNVLCFVEEGVSSVEDAGNQRADRMLRAARVHTEGFSGFASQPIKVRLRAIELLEDFARRRQHEYQKLIHSDLSSVKWLQMFHAICAAPPSSENTQYQIVDIT